MMKKFIALLLSFATVFSLAACGGGGGGGDYVATIKIGYYEAGYGTEFMDFWTEEYNKAHPDEQIYFDIDPNVGAAGIGSALENEAGMMDIYLSLATNWAGWARAGWIEPLDDLYEMENADGVKFEDAFASEGFAEYGKLDGHRYVIPQSGPMGNGFVYSEKMFQEHGWEVPETVDDLFELVETINNDPVNKDNNPNNDIAPFAWGGQVAAYWNTVVSMWEAQYEGPEYMEDFYQNPSPEKYATRTGLKKALTIFQDLICSGEGTAINSISGAMGKNHLLMQNDFVQGRAAMVSGIYGIVNETKEIIDEDCNLKCFLPTIDGAKLAPNGKPYTVMAGTDFDFMFIAKASKVKDYAKKFLLWISTQDMASAYIKYTAGGSPFKYNPDKLDGLHSLVRSAVDMAAQENFVVISTVSSHPINQLGKIVLWPMGEPYSSMVTLNTSPAKVIADNAAWVANNWATWERDSGMKN
jgi:hypothetical protein